MGKIVAALCLGISGSVLGSGSLDGEKIIIESGSLEDSAAQSGSAVEAKSENVFARLWHSILGVFGSKKANEGSVKHESGSLAESGTPSGSLGSGSEEPLFSLEPIESGNSESGSGSVSGSGSGSGSQADDIIPVFGGLDEGSEIKKEDEKENKKEVKKEKKEAKVTKPKKKETQKAKVVQEDDGGDEE